MADTKDYLTIYRRFFEEFATTVNPDDQLPVKVAGYYLCDSELVGEIVDWTLQYLNQKRCPSSLVAPITRIVVDEIKHACRKQPAACGYRTADNTYQPLKLMQVVTGKVNEVCLRYRDNGNLATLPPPSPGPPISSCAIKNTRRRMEDRHVIIEDFHAVFNIQDWSPTSYYAVFDGHAGTDAAVYSVSHLHQFLAESSFYPTDPERALKDAFSRTDALFLEKSNRENLRSGTTAVCALLRPKEKMLYVAWLGDSQAVLVRNGQAVRVVNPHKPDRQDERERIEVMGGCVLYWGTWRVNGQLAVSRAIGDPEYKPYVTAEPDVTAVPLNGAEDFLVLACDGLWDFVTEQEAIEAVYQQLCEAPGDLEAVSQRLVQLSKEQGSTDNISVIVVFLREPAQLAMDSNAGLLYKQNGTAAPSATDLYFLNRQDDDDDDLGPETDVDAVDDVLLSPAIAASKAAALSNNNPFSLEADLELQRQQLKDFDPESEPRRDTPTPPADQVAGEPGVAALVPESDNVAESGEDSEDEWNYYRVEPSADESQQSTQPICEKSVQLQLEDESNMESQLNPDAAEFVPSPTQPMPSMEEVLLAQSPRKGVPMEDISVPSQIEFQHEVSQRPSELDVTDKLPDLISSGLDNTTNPFVHNGGSYSDFLEDVERAQKSVLDESESSSTKAEFGDDSTVSFLTTGSELQKTVTESVSSLSAVEKSLAEEDLLGAEFTSGVSKSNNGSTCDENELSEFNESEMLVSKSVEENVLHKDSTVFINTEGTIPVCFELQKELIPEMELQPERVQLESEGTSSFEQDESGSPVGKKSEEPALSFQEKSAVNQLSSEDVPLGGLGTATSTPERPPMEQELLLSPEEDEEIKLCPDATGTLSPDLNEASLLQQCPEPTEASKASLLDFSLSHKVNLEPFTCEKLADNIEVMGATKEGPTFDMLTDECAMEEQEMSVTQTPPPTPAHMSDEEPIRIPPLSSPSLPTSKQPPSPTQISLYEQIHPQTEASLAQQISPSTLTPLPEQASSPILASVSEESSLPTLIPASEKAVSPTLASAFEEDPLLFLAPASEEALLPTLAPASEEAPLPILAPAPEEAPLPTLAPASEEALSPTLSPAPEETALPTLALASKETSLPTLLPASKEALSPTLSPASEEVLSPTLALASEEASSATLAPVPEQAPSPTLAPVSEEIPPQAPVSEQLPSLAPLSEQIPSLAPLSEQTPSVSEPVPSSTPISEPVTTSTSASEELMKVPSDSAVLAATVLAPAAIVPAMKAVSSEKKTSAKKPAPAKDKKVPVAAEKPKTASQKATAVTKTVQKSTPTSPTKPASSTIRSSTPKKPSSAAAAAAASKPTKSPLTSKPGVSPSKPPVSKTVASPRPRPAATGTAKPGSLSNGDVAKSAATKKPAATATRPPSRPATAPAGPKQVSSTVPSRTTAGVATAQRPKPGAVNGTAAKTRATGTVATAAARNKVAAARDTKLATDKQVKETANKHILSARTTTVTATRRVAGSVTRTTVTATGTVKATTATSKVGSKKTTTSTGVARTTTTTTTTKTTKTAASVNNESAVQVAD